MGWKQLAWKYLKVAVLRFVRMFPLLYKWGKLALRKGLWRVYAVKKGGLYAFALTVSIVLVGNWEAVMASVHGLNPAPLFAAWGQDLTHSYFLIKQALLRADTATGLQYLDIVVTIMIQLATIASYFIGARYLLEFIDRDMSPMIVVGAPTLFFLAISWGATGKVPVLHDIGFLIETVPELLEFGKLNPFASPEPVQGLNESVNASANASAVNMTAENLTGNTSS